MFDATPPSDHGDDLSSFDLPEVRPRNPSDKDLQRAEGSGRIVLSGSEEGTRIIDVFQRAPIRIMFPRTASSAVGEAVFVNTAGGIAGGDRLETGVTALGNASIIGLGLFARDSIEKDALHGVVGLQRWAKKL